MKQQLSDAPVQQSTYVGNVRKSEWVILAFLVYAAVLSLFLPVALFIRYWVILLNLAVLAGYSLLIHFDRRMKASTFGIIRDALTQALVILAYREMGWFAQPHLNHHLENTWVAWDRMVLRGGGRAVIEFIGPVLPSLLEISYGLVYAMAPFAVVMLYVYHRRERVDQLLFVFTLGVLLCYGQFPFWPSDPPRVLFAGEDLPSYLTVFRRFNLWMLGNYGIHTSVFPSAHVAGAFAIAFGASRVLPEQRWVGRFLLAMAILIAAATVYGRYHYLVDAVAGFVAALIGLAVGRALAGARL